MAKTKFNPETDVVTFTQNDMEQYATCNATIIDCQNRAEGLAQTIAGQLYIVAQKELYKIDDYKNVHEWAMDKHQIAKGTVSDSINTFARFGDGVTGNLLPQYSEYTFSTLMRMKGLTDEQIELAQINPTMSRAQVIDAIKALKVLEDKQKELPKLEKEWENTYKKYVEIEPDTDIRLETITRAVPEYMDKDHKLTAVDYETVISAVNSAIDYKESVNEWNYVLESLIERLGNEEATAFVHSIVPDTDIDKVSELSPEQLSRLLSSANQYLDELPEKEDNSTAEQNNEIEYNESVNEEIHSMPNETININNFRNEDESLNKKELLKVIWEYVQAVDAGDIDLFIVKTE